MKWHDARKEWPHLGACVIVFTNENDFFYGLAKHSCIDVSDRLTISLAKHYITHWCYLDDIPKPDDQ